MPGKRKRKPRVPAPTLLNVPSPYLAGAWQSPQGPGVLLADAEGNGVFVPSAIGTPLVVIPISAPPVEIPWHGFGDIQGKATVAAAGARNKAIWPERQHFERLFSHPLWLRLVAPLRDVP